MKQIPGFDNYCATKDGRIWSFPRRKSSKNGMWLKSFTHLSGHLSVCLYKNNKKFTKHIHRLVLETFVSKCPEGMECRHLDGNPANNSLDNLRWGTTKENMNDKIKHGKSNFGEKNNKHKLTDEKARMIIYMYKTGLFSLQEIANVYNVYKSTIHKIVQHKTWRHIWSQKGDSIVNKKLCIA